MPQGAYLSQQFLGLLRGHGAKAADKGPPDGADSRHAKYGSLETSHAMRAEHPAIGEAGHSHRDDNPGGLAPEILLREAAVLILGNRETVAEGLGGDREG